eukprot:6925044-Prymnesium_polylepis.2
MVPSPIAQEQQFLELAAQLGYTVQPTAQIRKEAGLGDRVSPDVEARGRRLPDDRVLAVGDPEDGRRADPAQLAGDRGVAVDQGVGGDGLHGRGADALTPLGLQASASDSFCAGISKGLKTESEKVIRVMEKAGPVHRDPPRDAVGARQAVHQPAVHPRGRGGRAAPAQGRRAAGDGDVGRADDGGARNAADRP